MKGELRGEGALDYVEPFRALAGKRAINLDRVKLFNKPSESVLDPEFKERVQTYTAASLYMSVGEGTTGLVEAIGSSRR